MSKVTTTQLNMSNDYFKAQGWFKNYALNSQDSRGVFQQLVKEDEEAFRLASAETDRIKAMMNEKYGSGTIKYGSEINTPPKTIERDMFDNAFTGIEDETREYYLKYLKDRPEGSKGKPIPLKDFAPEFIRENAAEGGRMGFYKGMSANKAKNKIKLKEPDTLKGFSGDRKLTKDQINALDPNYLGDFKGGDLERPKKIYKSGTSGSVLDDAIEIRNIIVNNKGNIFGLEELGEMAEIFGEGSRQGKKGNRPDIRKVKAALEVAKDNFPEIGNFKFVTDRYNIDGSQRRQLNMVVDTIKNYQNSKGSEKLANFLPENMGMLYKSLREANPEKGLYIKMYNFGPEQIKYISDRITYETGQTFNAKDYKNLVKEVKDFRGSLASDARQASRATAMNADIKKLYDDKVIQTLITGDLDNKSKKKILERAVDVLDDDMAVASRRLFMMAQSIAGTRPIEGINVDEDLGKKIIDTQRIIGKVGNNYAFSGLVYDHYGKTIDNALNSSKGKSFIGYYQQKIKNALDNGLVPDEIFSVTASARRGMHPYAIFTQALDAEVNSAIKGAKLDSKLSTTHRDLQKIFQGRTYDKLNTAEKKTVQGLVSDFENVKKDVLKDLKPKVRNTIQLPEFDLKNPPSKSLANYKSYDKNLQSAFDKTYKDVGYSMKTTKDMKTQKELLTQLESYITDTTGKVKQPMVSSGFAGAYEMLSDDLKKIVDSEGFKKFANSKTAKGLSTVARAPGKLFGLGDVLLGYLDYTNNKPMMSEAKAYQNMLQAMSFGIYRGGDEQNLKEIKEKFIANGGDGNIFDQVVTLNRQNADILQTVKNTKKNYKKNLENEKAFGNIIGNVGLKYQVDLPTASEQLKLDLNSLKNKAENMDKNFDIYKETYTGKDLTKPSKDLKRAAFDLLEEEQIKNYPSTYDQVNTESGPIMDKIYNSILTKDSYKKLLPQNIPSTINQLLGLNFKPVTEKEKEAALIQEMKKNAPQELYRYNKEFRNMDPDNPITMDETAKFMQKNKKTIGFSEGGITQLRSKYEYKK